LAPAADHFPDELGYSVDARMNSNEHRGLSKARLDRMHEVMAGHVARGQVPGLVTLISRRGETHIDAIGMKAVGGSDPMRRMKDTGFSIPHAKLERLATCYQTDAATGGLAVFDEARGSRFANPPVFESGGGGLVSTVDDCFAFGQMMLNMGNTEPHAFCRGFRSS
jgi:hypothetical protein